MFKAACSAQFSTDLQSSGWLSAHQSQHHSYLQSFPYPYYLLSWSVYRTSESKSDKFLETILVSVLWSSYTCNPVLCTKQEEEEEDEEKEEEEEEEEEKDDDDDDDDIQVDRQTNRQIDGWKG